MKTLILTPNKNEMCGMYQLAKDLAKEFDGSIMTKQDISYDTNPFDFRRSHYRELNVKNYNKIITLLHPMHLFGQRAKKEYGLYWICYDQKIPPVTKTYFPNFWRRQAMRYINWRNNVTMQGADEQWDVTEREQKPRWTEKAEIVEGISSYAIYLGRKKDYKNFRWLQRTMKELGIKFIYSSQYFKWTDTAVHSYLSNAKMLVTASIWEGFGRSVNEAQALKIPAVAYDVGAHKRHIKKGICVSLDINNMKESEKLFKKAILEVWDRTAFKKLGVE